MNQADSQPLVSGEDGKELLVRICKTVVDYPEDLEEFYGRLNRKEQTYREAMGAFGKKRFGNVISFNNGVHAKINDAKDILVELYTRLAEVGEEDISHYVHEAIRNLNAARALTDMGFLDEKEEEKEEANAKEK